MGTSLTADGLSPAVMISQIFINGSHSDLPQFITLYNPSDKKADLSGYVINKGVTAIIPGGTFINPNGRIFITGNAKDYLWDSVCSPVIQWSAGKLSDNGESLQLVDSHGIVMDYLEYSENTWPAAGFEGKNVFTLIDPALDNHFGENWTTSYLTDAMGLTTLLQVEDFLIYPNPTNGIIYINYMETTSSDVEIFDISGRLLNRFRLNQSGSTSLDLSEYGAGLYLLKIGTRMEKVVVVE
jgi:hypothetical protein